MRRHLFFLFTSAALFLVIVKGAEAVSSVNQRVISFGTALNPETAVNKARQLAHSVSEESTPKWQTKGDQKRTYYFPEADAEIPYRICVPGSWDGISELPLVMYLHGAGSDENTYLDMNDGQMIKLAEEYGFLLVSPLGYQGAYGNFLRLTAPFGNSAGAEKLMAQVTESSERNNRLSEQDVLNVLELVLNEYPVDKTAMFLSGHSMGSGGTWYIGGKYPDYWTALAPMSGPFVQETGYPWKKVGVIPVFITEGSRTPSLDASRLLHGWMAEQGCNVKYLEVDADHGGMIRLVMPDVFAFSDSCRGSGPVSIAARAASHRNGSSGISAAYHFPNQLRITLNSTAGITDPKISIVDISGKERHTARLQTNNKTAILQGVDLPAGVYQIIIFYNMQRIPTTFTIVR